MKIIIALADNAKFAFIETEHGIYTIDQTQSQVVIDIEEHSSFVVTNYDQRNYTGPVETDPVKIDPVETDPVAPVETDKNNA